MWTGMHSASSGTKKNSRLEETFCGGCQKPHGGTGMEARDQSIGSGRSGINQSSNMVCQSGSERRQSSGVDLRQEEA